MQSCYIELKKVKSKIICVSLLFRVNIKILTCVMEQILFTENR